MKQTIITISAVLIAVAGWFIKKNKPQIDVFNFDRFKEIDMYGWTFAKMFKRDITDK